MSSSLDGLLWSRSALCHPRVLIRPGFDEYRVHIERGRGQRACFSCASQVGTAIQSK
jgi:hypothetical protein